MTNSDESDSGVSDEETNENWLPTLPQESTVGCVSKTRSLDGELCEEELGKDNILQLPQDLANVSCNVDLILYFCTQVQTIRDGRLKLYVHSAFYCDDCFQRQGVNVTKKEISLFVCY